MEKLQVDKCYHICNHANGFENLFQNEENMRFFLGRYERYISPIVETYAYALMPNHFHFVIRIISLKEYFESGNSSFLDFLSGKAKYLSELETLQKTMATYLDDQNFKKVASELKELTEVFEIFISKQFSKLFSSYTQSFNKMWSRRGSLFMTPFKRRPLTDSEMQNIILYVVCNPVHHGFVEDVFKWKYNEPKSLGPLYLESLNHQFVLELFESFENYKFCLTHNRYSMIEE